jgi:hypothetical protein
LTDETSADKKLSRRQFMGTAAAGAVVLGAVAGAKSFAPHVMVAGEKVPIPVAAPAPSVVAKAQSVGIPSSWDYTADVVVVGNGGAGSSAAIAAYDGGASVLILEKAPKGLDGGNTGVSGGIPTIYSPLTDWITLVNMMCWGTTPLDVVTAFCTEVTNLPNYIKSLGGQLQIGSTPAGTGIPPPFYLPYVSPDFKLSSYYIAVPPFSYPTKGTSPTGSNGGGKDFFAFLDNCRSSRNIPILYQTPGKQLIQNPTTKEVIGVMATDWTGQDIFVQANKAVVLTCGGYENNPEIKANFMPETPKDQLLTFYGTPYNTGDGIYMSEQVGAKLWHMNKKEVHAIACAVGSAETGLGLTVGSIGYGAPGALTLPMIYVNRYGNRFMNEYCYPGHNDQTKEYDYFQETFSTNYGGNYYLKDFCDWPNFPFYAIFDSKVMQAGGLGPAPGPNGSRFAGIHNLYSWSPDNSKELANGWIVTAATPKDLGAKITCRDFFGAVVGMDPVGLDATVTAWNAACAAGADNAFGRPAPTLKPLTSPPFYAMQLIECQTNTDGGPAHDAKNRVLDVNNNPIPRLYAAGELGSLWGGLYYGGGNVPEAVAMGRVAGANAATLASWTQ